MGYLDHKRQFDIEELRVQVATDLPDEQPLVLFGGLNINGEAFAPREPGNFLIFDVAFYQRMDPREGSVIWIQNHIEEVCYLQGGGTQPSRLFH